MVSIGNVPLGEGIPKICVPLMATTLEELREECQYIGTVPHDILEFRADSYLHEMNLALIDEALAVVKELLPESPILFTFRTKEEGGLKSIRDDEYFELLTYAIHRDKVAAIDIEYRKTENQVLKMIQKGRENNVTVILSNHEFSYTPSTNEIINRLEKMIALGGHVAKIACMPKSPDDVLHLLEATRKVHKTYPEVPLITISMGALGGVSRLTGQLFGSAITFGVGKDASAPGQIKTKDLEQILKLLSY